jgi:hypothetical protein
VLIHLVASSLLFSLLAQSSSLRWTFDAAKLGSLPTGWEIRGTDKPVYQVRDDSDGNRFLSASSRDTDSQLGIQLTVKPQDYPTLSWRWRVHELPPRADERNQKTLDSAASVYAVFGSRLFPRILKYVWSTSVPAGSSFKHPTSGRMAIFVVASGSSSFGQWHGVKRNLLEDYREAFGSEPGNLIAIAVKTDSDSTKSSARADYDDIQLARR